MWLSFLYQILDFMFCFKNAPLYTQLNASFLLYISLVYVVVWDFDCSSVSRDSPNLIINVCGSCRLRGPNIMFYRQIDRDWNKYIFFTYLNKIFVQSFYFALHALIPKELQYHLKLQVMDFVVCLHMESRLFSIYILNVLPLIKKDKEIQIDTYYDYFPFQKENRLICTTGKG